MANKYHCERKKLLSQSSIATPSGRMAVVELYGSLQEKEYVIHDVVAISTVLLRHYWKSCASEGEVSYERSMSYSTHKEFLSAGYESEGEELDIQPVVNHYDCGLVRWSDYRKYEAVGLWEVVSGDDSNIKQRIEDALQQMEIRRSAAHIP